MKKVFVTTILFIMLLSPVNTVSAELSAAERITLLTQIQTLLIQLLDLKEQLASLQSDNVQGVSARKLVPSTYYDGEYEAIYIINGATLSPYKNTVFIQDDKNLWELFKDVVGEDVVRSYISEFRLYKDRDSEFDAFVELTNDSEGWMVGVNIANTDIKTQLQREGAIELFTHEYAHILYHYTTGIAKEFENQFWGRQSHMKQDFVSDYAMINFEEDFAESFMYFVMYRRPSRVTIGDEKVLFFYNYEVYRDIRDGIHDRLFD